ncbi:SDR family oxidoreductase [Spirochaeta dissipatitropha]
MKILFLGGSGIISSACSALAVEQGMELSVLNRGKTQLRPLPPEVEQIRGDLFNPQELKTLLKGRYFDAVVQFMAFVPAHIQNDIDCFRDICGQYIFISSASAYHTPPLSWPVTESTPLHNPFWEYSRNKAVCEQLLQTEYINSGFPMTIVRPSHTYDKTLIPLHGGYTNIQRMKAGKPIVMHGDGSSLWTLTHHRDFAKGLIGLLGNEKALGEAVHITSDEALTWNAIAQLMARALGTEARLVCAPSEVIARYDREWGDGLLGDKTHSMVFDNSKLKRLVPGFQAVIPFHQGVREIIDWYEQNPEQQKSDPVLDATMDRIIADMQSLGT